MLFAGLEPNRIQLDLIGRVVGLLLDRFLVEDERGIVILNRFRFFTLVEIRLALRTARCEQSETNPQKYASPSALALSVASTRSLFRLSLTFKSLQQPYAFLPPYP